MITIKEANDIIQSIESCVPGQSVEYYRGLTYWMKQCDKASHKLLTEFFDKTSDKVFYTQRAVDEITKDGKTFTVFSYIARKKNTWQTLFH